jgi:hypothetical protein
MYAHTIRKERVPKYGHPRRKHIREKPPNNAIPAYRIIGDSSLSPFGIIGCRLIRRQMIIGTENIIPPASPHPKDSSSKYSS